MFINRKSNVSYLKCVAFFSFIRLNNSHISSKVTSCYKFNNFICMIRVYTKRTIPIKSKNMKKRLEAAQIRERKERRSSFKKYQID